MVISTEQWQKAHEIINQAKKESAIEESERIQNFIKERDRTFWKLDSSSSTSYFHIYVDKKEGHYATVYEFEFHTSGEHEIKNRQYSMPELNSFLDGKSADSIDNESMMDDCECDSYEEEELPKTNIKNVTEEEFKKKVQEKVLDRYSIGLIFKVENKK